MSVTRSARGVWQSAPLAGLAVATLLGCGPEAPTDRTPAPRSSLPAAPGPIDALTRRFSRLRQRLAERGEAPASGPARWFVLEGEGIEAPLDLPTDRCSTLVALGGGGLRDLRLALYDGEGREIAVDAIPGEGALVHVCPSSDAAAPASDHAPYHLVATSESGAGALLVAGFTIDAGTRPRFDGVFDGLLAPRVERVVVEARLARAREPLVARGLVPESAPTLGTLVEGGTLRRTEELSPDHCYTVVAAATDDLVDADLFVYDPQGAEIAREIGRDAAPALQFCPLEAGLHTIEARAFAGSGGVGLELLRGPAQVAASTPVTDASDEPPDARSAGLEDADIAPAAALEPVLASLTARGYGRATRVEGDGAIAPGDERTHALVAPAGCVVVLGAGSGRGADLDLTLTDARGAPLARDTSVQTVARAAFCQPGAGTVHATVKAYGRAGQYALAMVSAPRGIGTPQALRLDEARASFVGRGYRSASTSAITLAQGDRRALPFSVRGGTCAALAVAGEPGLTDIDLFLRDADGRLLVRDSGPAPFASVSRCAAGDETLHVEVVAYRGSGSVAVERLEAEP